MACNCVAYQGSLPPTKRYAKLGAALQQKPSYWCTWSVLPVDTRLQGHKTRTSSMPMDATMAISICRASSKHASPGAFPCFRGALGHQNSGQHRVLVCSGCRGHQARTPQTPHKQAILLLWSYLKMVKFKNGAPGVFTYGVFNDGHPDGHCTEQENDATDCSKCSRALLAFATLLQIQNDICWNTECFHENTTFGQEKCRTVADRFKLWPNLELPENRRF